MRIAAGKLLALKMALCNETETLGIFGHGLILKTTVVILITTIMETFPRGSDINFEFFWCSVKSKHMSPFFPINTDSKYFKHCMNQLSKWCLVGFDSTYISL